MNKFFKLGFYALAVLSLSITTISCNEKDDPVIDPKPDPTELELKGELTGERILEAGETYTLSGEYRVKSGGNLIIEEGVIIEAAGDTRDYILVEQGAKINASGTKERPIVMTAKEKDAGAWGGLHICGKAPINLTGGTGTSEIGNATFGGSDPADNSGVIRYVRLEYTGYALDEETESNGLTLYGVGSGTTIEYIQAYKGADDGIEWFGGTVNVKYLVVTACEDDSFDWTDGWIGKGQFMVAIQDQTAPGADGTANGDCLIEADNRETNFDLTPTSSPTLANLTLIGNNDNNAQKRAVRLRAGTHVKIYNALVTGKPNSVTTATAQTEQSFLDGASVIEYLSADKSFTYENGAALALDTKEGNAVNQTISLTGGYIGTVDGGKDMSSDSFFTQTAYKGAVPANNDWTAGWTEK